MRSIEQTKQKIETLVRIVGGISEEPEILVEPKRRCSYQPQLFVDRIDLPGYNTYYYDRTPSELLVESLRAGVVGASVVGISERTKNILIEQINTKLDGERGIYSGRSLIVARSGPEADWWIMARPRITAEIYGQMVEIPGGKVDKTDKAITVRRCLVQAERELYEEAGELSPNANTEKGICLGLTTNQKRWFIEVARVRVVTPATLMYLCQAANARKREENIEANEGNEKFLWVPMIFPRMVKSEQFIPTTALEIQALKQGESMGKIGEWEGVAAYLPYRRSFDEGDGFRKSWLAGKRRSLEL